MSEFKVGDVCIGQGHVLNLQLNGMECEIIGPLRFAIATQTNGELFARDAYLVRWADGSEMYAAPHNLRKRRPPSTDESVSRQAMLDCIERAKRGMEVPA